MVRESLILILAIAATPVQAQPPVWPERAVRLVVPSPGGSGIDLLARMLALRLATHWGKPVIVENRAGANSIIGTHAVARSAPDGHTLLFCSDATFTLNPHLYAKLPYDPFNDFVPITQVVTFAQLLVAHPQAGAGNFAELVAAARANPGAITYASAGTGSVAHLMSELLKRKAGIDLLHVPYNGFAPALNAVISGEASVTWAGIFSTRSHVHAGRLRAIGVASPRRSRFMPEVPTFPELGIPELDIALWFGLFAPAATPSTVVDTIYRDVARLIAEPEVRDKEFIARAYEPSGLAPSRFAELIRREFADRLAMVRMSIPQGVRD